MANVQATAKQDETFGCKTEANHPAEENEE
jgi:hypothetical protein